MSHNISCDLAILIIKRELLNKINNDNILKEFATK